MTSRGMSAESIARARAACEAASPPHLWEEQDLTCKGLGWNTGMNDLGNRCGAPCPDVKTEEQAEADCRFAILARTDLPAALDEIDRLRAELGGARAVLGQCRAALEPFARFSRICSNRSGAIFLGGCDSDGDVGTERDTRVMGEHFPVAVAALERARTWLASHAGDAG